MGIDFLSIGKFVNLRSSKIKGFVRKAYSLGMKKVIKPSDWWSMAARCYFPPLVEPGLVTVANYVNSSGDYSIM